MKINKKRKKNWIKHTLCKTTKQYNEIRKKERKRKKNVNIIKCFFAGGRFVGEFYYIYLYKHTKLISYIFMYTRMFVCILFIY